MNKVLNLGLCAGRHEIPQVTDGYVFNEVSADLISNPEKLEIIAFHRLWDKAYKKGYTHVPFDWDGCDMEPHVMDSDIQINLYVTGLTVTLIAFLNACRNEGIHVTLWHFNRDTNEYFPQLVK